MNLKNKVIVITGASKGLGKALAVVFCNEGAKVIINAQSKRELSDASKETGALQCVGDVTKETDMKRLGNFAIKKYGKIDVWINNAGITTPRSPIEDIDIKLAHKVMEVNFFGTLYGSRVAMKIMKKQTSGTIINIISKGSLNGRPLSALYSSTKWAVRGFTLSLRLALKPEHIFVLAVHPGGIKTTIFGKNKPAEYKDWMEPSYVATKIIQNLKKKKPKEEIIIDK